MLDTVATRPAVRPPVKWVGGKRWQVRHLRPTWKRHEHRRLVEPFCGGLAIALGLRPSRALLNDANPHLISFYRWLKQGLTIDLDMQNDEAAFYRCRDRFNELLREHQSDTQEAASLFYYLNRTGYNGLCRFNQSGEFNVPFGRHKRLVYTTQFEAYRDALASWEFTRLDFEAMQLQEDDFVYADPPYDVPFTQYAKDGFDWDDQERAAIFFAKHAGPVILVNQSTPRVEQLYESLGYRLIYLDAPRRISCTGDRTPAREIVATRNL